MICVETEKLASDCPITKIFFVSAPDLEPYNNTNYTALPYLDAEYGHDIIYLVYSKNVSDTLPVMSTKVEQVVCLLPSQQFQQNLEEYYPLEYNLEVQNCTYQHDYQATYDDRYRGSISEVTAAKVNEFDI